MNTPIIEIVELNLEEGQKKVIVECNLYDENNVLIIQYSRSPFSFPETYDNDEIINVLRYGEYSKYF